MLASPLPPSFLNTDSFSMSFLGYKVFCIDMSFLVLWSICWSSSLVHIKNGPEYLTRGQPRCLSLWWDFFYVVFFRIVFSFFWRILFKFFFHLHLFDGIHFQNSRVFVGFLFSECSEFFLVLVILFLPSHVIFCSSLFEWHIFLFQIPSQYRRFICTLLVLKVLILFHFWQTVLYRPCTLVGWFFLAIYEVASAWAFRKYVIECHHCYYK